VLRPPNAQRICGYSPAQSVRDSDLARVYAEYTAVVIWAGGDTVPFHFSISVRQWVEGYLQRGAAFGPITRPLRPLSSGGDLYGYDARAVRLMVVDAYCKRNAALFGPDGYRSTLVASELGPCLEKFADDYLPWSERIQLSVFPRMEKVPPSQGDITEFHGLLAGRRLGQYVQYLEENPTAEHLPPLSTVLGPKDESLPFSRENSELSSTPARGLTPAN